MNATINPFKSKIFPISCTTSSEFGNLIIGNDCPKKNTCTLINKERGILAIDVQTALGNKFENRIVQKVIWELSKSGLIRDLLIKDF